MSPAHSTQQAMPSLPCSASLLGKIEAPRFEGRVKWLQRPIGIHWHCSHTFHPPEPPSRLLCPTFYVRRYVHRVGRTGRAGQSGAAISLLAPSEAGFAAELDAELAGHSAAQHSMAAAGAAAGREAAGAAGAAGVGEDGEDDGAAGTAQVLRPFESLTRAAVEGLRYRGEDVARSITKNVIKEVTNELLMALSRMATCHCYCGT